MQFQFLGTFSDDDIPPTALDSGKLKNIYVGLKSKMLAYKLSTIYANEATRADGWNPEAQTVLGIEKRSKPLFAIKQY